MESSNTSTNGGLSEAEFEFYIFVGKLNYMEYLFGCIAFMPLLCFLANYIYLVFGLIRKKIWKNKPFYIIFIVLGVSDCLLITRHVIVSCGMTIWYVSINPDSSFILQLLMTVIEQIYWNAFNLSSAILGVIAMFRFIAVYFPIFYNNQIKKIGGWLAAIIAMVIAFLPTIIGHFTTLNILYQDPLTGQFYTMVDSPLPDNEPYSWFVYIFLPMIMSSVFPMTLYCFIGVKLWRAGNNTNTGERKTEFTFLVVGLWLCSCSLIVGIMFIFLSIFYSTVSFDTLVKMVGLGLTAECLMFCMNPFVYWIVDPTIKKEVPAPWKLCKNKIAPMEAAATAQPITAFQLNAATIQVAPNLE